MNESVSADGRQPYEPPTVEDLPLRPTEQILAGCKTFSGGATQGGAGPSQCAAALGCVSPGAS